MVSCSHAETPCSATSLCSHMSMACVPIPVMSYCTLQTWDWAWHLSPLLCGAERWHSQAKACQLMAFPSGLILGKRKEWPKGCLGFEFWVAERSFPPPIAKTHLVVVGCLLGFLHCKTSEYFRWEEIFTIKHCQWGEIHHLLYYQQTAEWCPPLLRPSSATREGREILLLRAREHWEVHTTAPPCQHPLPRALETTQNVSSWTTHL